MLSYQTDPILLSTVTLFLKCIRGSWGIRYSSWGIFVCIFLFFNQLRLNLRFHTSLAYSAQYFSTLSYNFFLYVSVSPLEFFLDWWMNVDINATHQYFWFSSPEYTRGGGVVAINLALASKMWAEVLGQKHLTTSVRFSRALPPPRHQNCGITCGYLSAINRLQCWASTGKVCCLDTQMTLLGQEISFCCVKPLRSGNRLLLQHNSIYPKWLTSYHYLYYHTRNP